MDLRAKWAREDTERRPPLPPHIARLASPDEQSLAQVKRIRDAYVTTTIDTLPTQRERDAEIEKLGQAIPRPLNESEAMMQRMTRHNAGDYLVSGHAGNVAKSTRITHFGTRSFLGEVRSNRGPLLGLKLTHIKN